MKTIVFIGNFSGELDSIKEALIDATDEFRCVCFLDPRPALALIERNRLDPDCIIIDDQENIAASKTALVSELRAQSSLLNVPIVFYSLNLLTPSDRLDAANVYRLEKFPEQGYAKYLTKILSRSQT